MHYAGFWRRFGAYIVDSIILTIGLGIVFFVLNMVGLQILETADYSADADELSAAAAFSLSPVATIILIAVSILYFPVLESSAMQATPGKLALGIKVTDLQGNRISFLRSLGRNLGKIVSSIILCIGYIMAGFTARKQALHDIMAGCLVLAKPA